MSEMWEGEERRRREGGKRKEVRGVWSVGESKRKEKRFVCFQ